LVEHCAAGPDGVACHERALDLAVRAKNTATLNIVADRYAAMACGDAAMCARSHERVGRAFLELAAPGLALRQFTAAAQAVPNAEHWLLAADAAARSGSPAAARRALLLAKREPMSAEQIARELEVEQLLSHQTESN
jgi:hypothetical protein